MLYKHNRDYTDLTILIDQEVQEQDGSQAKGLVTVIVQAGCGLYFKAVPFTADLSSGQVYTDGTSATVGEMEVDRQQDVLFPSWWGATLTDYLEGQAHKRICTDGDDVPYLLGRIFSIELAKYVQVAFNESRYYSYFRARGVDYSEYPAVAELVKEPKTPDWTPIEFGVFGV